MKLTIEKVIYGGQGLARIPETEGALSGKRIFVPFTLPGEQVRASLVEDTRGYTVGQLQQIDAASPQRTQPACPHFTHCGGCQLQHAAYAAQIDIKRGVLLETLARAGLKDIPEISALHGTPLAYRNRMRLHLQTQPHFAIGYREQAAHTLVPIEQCPIVTPVLQQCLQAIRALGEEQHIPEGISEMELFTNHDGSAVVLSAFTTQQDHSLQQDSEAFFTSLAARVPELTGAALFLRQTGRNAKPEPQPLLRWKAQNLIYRVGAHSYQVSIGSFFQINQSMLGAFVALVTDGLHGKLAWDLYAGVGLFARVLAEKFQQVTAVEASATSSKDLQHNLHVLPANVIHATTNEFLSATLEQRTVSPDLAVLDPPRAGLGMETANLLARCRPQRIVYVSCDPATLSRDLKALTESGYRLHRLHMVDMFPQTYHQETVAVLLR
ncbi:MAG TPA: 23S rRNA (uracil(1939)-C(5))-methyltransferase RlmD [Acidobacteriaceae bacterium]|jgi:23S rRNA (uracil1939-C5)-methyltransferase|nr:23S rRNA (uracil(1939)-C(5))-methyltransferase RlmD [Acidobacteriaceae bacterium]